MNAILSAERKRLADSIQRQRGDEPASVFTPFGSSTGGRNMGDILIAAGRLSREDAARIAGHQQREKLPFGEAAKVLGLLKQDDIDYALSQQFDYHYLQPGQTRISQELVAAFQPFGRMGEHLRALRSQLQLRWLQPGQLPRAMAIVSPARGEGRSFIAANLAVVFAQQGQRTLLVDANLRHPRLGALFNTEGKAGLSSLLADRSEGDGIQPVPDLRCLHVLAAGHPPPNPQELLGRAAFGQLLQNAAAQYDVVLVDTPATDDCADAELIAVRTGTAMVVARKNQSSLPAVQQLGRRLQDNGVAMLGSVLNDA